MRIDPKLIEEGYINVQKHPTLDYYIYNYSHLAQIKQHWVKDTRRCRGLILDGQGNVIARPFEKFHNVEEYSTGSGLGELPKYNSFQAFEKMDGSLGILYMSPETTIDCDCHGKPQAEFCSCRGTGKLKIARQPFIATRGSFVSDQAKVANEILEIRYSHVKFQPQYTYLFEIIYPENRIVLDYGTTKDLILLSIIDNVTGKDLDWRYIKAFAKEFELQLVKSYTSVMPNFFWVEDNMKEDKTREGYVILFDNVLRVKVKFEEYKRLHRLIFGLSTKSIWEVARSGGNVFEYRGNLPKEFYEWARQEYTKIKAEFYAVEHYCFTAMAYPHKEHSMKEVAEFFKTCKYQSVLFAMYRGKPYENIIWKIIEPDYKRPFTGEEIK